MDSLPAGIALFKEYYSLLVRPVNVDCHTNCACVGCSLNDICWTWNDL